MISVSVSVTGLQEVRDLLSRINPAQSPGIVRQSLRKAALRVQSVAASESIIRGGKQRPHPTRLTSRTGTGRRSIGVDYGELPARVSIGSALGYMALHEQGGTVLVPGSIVAAHRRKTAFGKRVKPFTVPQHYRSAHSATFPPRPWLAPALDKVRGEIPGIFLREWTRLVGGR